MENITFKNHVLIIQENFLMKFYIKEVFLDENKNKTNDERLIIGVGVYYGINPKHLQILENYEFLAGDGIISFNENYKQKKINHKVLKIINEDSFNDFKKTLT